MTGGCGGLHVFCVCVTFYESMSVPVLMKTASIGLARHVPHDVWFFWHSGAVVGSPPHPGLSFSRLSYQG